MEDSPRSSEVLNMMLIVLLHCVHACVIGASHGVAGTCHVLSIFCLEAVQLQCLIWQDAQALETLKRMQEQYRACRDKKEKVSEKGPKK